MTSFTKVFISEKPLKIAITDSNASDKNVITILGVNFKLLGIVGAE